MTPEQIKTLRAELGLSQSQLANRLNDLDPYLRILPSTISRWENGKHTPAPHVQGALQALAAQAGVDVPPLSYRVRESLPIVEDRSAAAF